MRSSLAPLLLAGALLFGCAKPQPADTGGAGNSGSGNTSGGAGTTGSGNTTGSGSSGTTGSGNTSGTAGTGGPACVANASELVTASGWNCDLATPIMIQGAWYGYGDGTSCPATTNNPCTTGKCRMMGDTSPPDPNYARWGCGMGMELSSSGGTTPVKSVYTGGVKGFMITITGSSGGNVVRIGYTQSATPPSGAVAPFKEIAAFTSGWTGEVDFADVTCPSWAGTTNPCTKAVGMGTPVDLQIQVSAGSTTTTVGPFDLSVTSVQPVLSGSTGTGGSTGTSSCTTPNGSGTLTTQYADAKVNCPKEYIVQNNAWGSTAGQTVTFGPGTKMKVTVQNETRTNSSTPAGYPSIFTGAYNNRSTAGSGLPRAISSIAAGQVQTSWTWADNGAAGSYNAAYDVWFSTGSGGDPAAAAPSGGYLMVWFNDSPLNQPIGSAITNGAVTIGGKQFNIWYGMNGSKPCVSYVAQQNFTSWTFSLGDFIQDAIGRNCSGTTKCLSSTWYLTNVFAGFEIWYGGVGLETKDFGVTVP